MSMRELKEGLEKKKVLFGIRQAIKKGKKLKNIFISKDARDETVSKLEKAGLEFSVLKQKQEIARELNLDFECEVYSIIKK